MDFLEQLKCLFLSQISFLAFVTECKQVSQVFVPSLFVFAQFGLEPLVKVRVKDSQHQGHQKVHLKQHVDNEENAPDPLPMVSWQHNVREVCCRHQDEHVDPRLFKVVEVLSPLEGSEEHSFSHESESCHCSQHTHNDRN